MAAKEDTVLDLKKAIGGKYNFSGFLFYHN